MNSVNGKMMAMPTRDFGDVEIDISNIITFPKGIIAFEGFTDYVLLSPLGDNKFPMWLQCVQKKELCFTVFDPKELCDNYSIQLQPDDVEVILGVENESFRYLAIAVIPEDYKKATANLKSPLVINTANKTAVQVITTEDYPIRFPIYERSGD